MVRTEFLQQIAGFLFISLGVIWITWSIYQITTDSYAVMLNPPSSLLSLDYGGMMSNSFILLLGVFILKSGYDKIKTFHKKGVD